MKTHEIELTAYAKFRPTQFDTAGLGLDDRQDWLMCCVSHNRDSGILAESNWASALKMLGGEGDDVEVHRFGHWGPGWFEIIIVRPSSAAHRTAQEIEAALSDYPILDESDHSEREWEAAHAWWKDMGLRERIRACAKFDVSVFAARREDAIPERVDTYWLAEGC